MQNDRDNGRLTNTVVALITKNTSRVNESTPLLIDLGTAKGRQSSLRQTSALVCTNLFTFSQVKILRVIGSLPAALMVKVDDCLKAALALP